MWSDWFNRHRRSAQLILGQSYWASCTVGGVLQQGQSSGWLESLNRAVKALDESGESPRGVCIWLTGQLCPALWLQPPEGMLGADEWRAWLPAGVAAQHPLADALTDPIIWTEKGKPIPTLGAAVPGAWLDTFKEALAPDRPLTGVRPLWRSALASIDRREIASLDQLTVYDGESATALDSEGRVFSGANSMAIAEFSGAWSWHSRRAVSATKAMPQSKFLRLDVAGALSGGSLGAKAWNTLWVESESP